MFDVLLSAMDLRLAEPTRDQVLEAAEYTELKDAPVVSAAMIAGATHLVTFDRKHLVDRALVSERAGREIVLPKDLLMIVRGARDVRDD
jgi:hypothetical protein